MGHLSLGAKVCVGLLVRVTWQDVNETEEPGLYPLGEVWVQVERKQIVIWRAHPDAVFTGKPYQSGGRTRYLLASWEAGS